MTFFFFSRPFFPVTRRDSLIMFYYYCLLFWPDLTRTRSPLCALTCISLALIRSRPPQPMRMCALVVIIGILTILVPLLLLFLGRERDLDLRRSRSRSHRVNSGRERFEPLLASREGNPRGLAALTSPAWLEHSASWSSSRLSYPTGLDH